MSIVRYTCFFNFKNGRKFHDLKFVVHYDNDDDGDGVDGGDDGGTFVLSTTDDFSVMKSSSLNKT